ncbi:MAG TPA: ATP-dependent Clp protease ATP-binding subunit ClpA, partial [Syntrophobacteraceae bacterium]|nr:ATP-dependent Clp protease ATP-binding subunit ClpA [Syntrophobacteraceae bacterium]
NGKKADFRNVILLMTSNAGAREMTSPVIGFGAEGDASGAERAAKGIKAVEKLFSPEFRNRLDGVVGFHGLNQDIMEKVVDKFMQEVEGQLSEKRIRLELSEAARQWLAEKGYDPAFGARPLARLIQTEIKDVLADEILFGRLREGGHVLIDRVPEGEPEKEGMLATSNLTFHFVTTSPER